MEDDAVAVAVAVAVQRYQPLPTAVMDAVIPESKLTMDPVEILNATVKFDVKAAAGKTNATPGCVPALA